MALIAGAGNPAGGSNPAGTGGNINYVGGNTYAGWSGQVTPTNGSPITALDFTTPSDSAWKVNIAFGIDTSTLASGELVGYELKQNGEIIFERFNHPSAAQAPYFDDTSLILAGSSEIEFICQTTDTSGIPMTVCLTLEAIL